MGWNGFIESLEFVLTSKNGENGDVNRREFA